MNTDGTVKSKQKISSTQGGFGSGLANNDYLGISAAPLGDLDGDGVSDLAVGAHESDDGGTDRGAIWILFMNTNGTVKAKQKISQTAGSFSGSLINGGNFGRGMAFLGVGQDGRHTIVVGAHASSAPLNPGEIWLLTINTCSIDPEITEHPESVLLGIGGGVVQFSVAAEGSGTLAYQWRRDGVRLGNDDVFSDVDTPSLAVDASQNSRIGIYDCVVSSERGSTQSQPAILGIRQLVEVKTCFGDLDGDGLVNGSDLGSLLGAWGFCPR